MPAAPSFNPARLTLNLLQRTLYWFTRTLVFPPTASELGLDPARPVCYVLQYRHLSNLLVLEREAENLGLPPVLPKRSVFFLSRRPPKSMFDKAPDSIPPLMRELVATVLAKADHDVQLIPVGIYWGCAPGRKDSILKALLADSWRHSGGLRQMLAILLHGRHTVVRFSTPLSLRELLAEENDPKRGERKLSRLLRVHFRRQREQVIGPDLSHRHTLVKTLLATPKVQAAIRHEAELKKIPLGTAEIAAQKIVLEIAADYSYTVIRALELFLDWLWTRLYDGIELHGFERVTAVAPGHGIVYVPCHRSHIDYLLLSFIVFRQGLTPPHIAAGANLNMPLVGPLLRRGGAFFLRRSFKGDALYATLFIEYLQSILQRGFPVEYFIEGGRSRSGRTLPPKAGILSMTLQGFAANPARPLVFIPVYIGYEKVMEGRTYLAELNGQSKRTESLLDLIKAIRRLRRDFGKVHVNFGEPLEATTLLDNTCPEWRQPAPNVVADLRPAIDFATRDLGARINAAAVLNPINLFALALLGTHHRVADRSAVQTQIAHLQSLHATSAYPGVSKGNSMTPDAIVEHAIRLDLCTLQSHPLGDLVCADPDQGALLAYARNNVLHLFALTGMIACLLSHHRELPASRVTAAVTQLYPLLRAELFLPWDDAELPDAIHSAAQALAERQLITINTNSARWRAPEIGDELNESLLQIGQLVRPLLERLYLLLAVLMQQGSLVLTATQLLDTVLLLAQRIDRIHHGTNTETADRTQFVQLLRTLMDAGMVKEAEDARLSFDTRISEPAAQAELLLDASIRHAIQRMAATPAA